MFSKILYDMVCNRALLIIYVLVRYSPARTSILTVYVDIVSMVMIIIVQLKAYLSSHSHMKDLGLLQYFIGIKVVRSKKSNFLSMEVPYY